MSDCCAWLISLVSGENGAIKQILQQFSDDNCTESCPMDKGMEKDELLSVIYYRYFPEERRLIMNPYIRNFNYGKYDFSDKLGRLVRANKDAFSPFIKKNNGGKRTKRTRQGGKRRKSRRGKMSKKQK